MIKNIWYQIISAIQWTWGYDFGKILLIGLVLIYIYGIVVDIKNVGIKT